MSASICSKIKIITICILVHFGTCLITVTSPSASGNKKFSKTTKVFSGIGPPVFVGLLVENKLFDEIKEYPPRSLVSAPRANSYSGLSVKRLDKIKQENTNQSNGKYTNLDFARPCNSFPVTVLLLQLPDNNLI